MSSFKKVSFKATILSLVFLLFSASISTSTFASEASVERTQTPNNSSSEEVIFENQEVIEGFEELFLAIENMPDEIAYSEDEEMIREWLISEMNLLGNNEGEFQTFGVVGCTSAIGLAILTNAIPIAKISKVRDAIRAAGGARTFANSLITNYDLYRSAGYARNTAVNRAVRRAASDAGPETRRALLDFFNIGNVYSACFE
jgi:hypothetical protein